MKTVKSLLLGTAAGFVALTGANAADLPMAEPVEYVKICDTYGKGYFYIPGTDTCLKISGYVRVETYVDFNDGTTTDIGDFVGSEELDTLTWYARGDVRFDARTETEWGTLRSFIELRATKNGRAGWGVDAEQAFIQFAGFTIGRAQSFYDFIPYSFYGDLFSDRKLEQVAYTASFGSGFAATIAVEDKTDRYDDLGYQDGGLGDNRGSQAWPNIVAALRVDQAWGTAQVSVAIQDQVGNETEDLGDVVADDIGFAVQAGLSYNLSFANKGSFVWAQGAYAEGAVDYVLDNKGVDGGLVGQISNVFHDTTYDIVAGEWVNNEIWAVGGGVHIQATETVHLGAGAIYWEFDEQGFSTAEGLKVLGRIGWEPVSGLHLGTEVAYASVDFGDRFIVPDDNEQDDLRLTMRAQRSF